ncbi:Eukaryotic aspartyl protease family protein [Striga hermonthica]|uniref:Eukaryotic aspartyl protease family protein n=1 Tax=Striga hermonthica TaxID=68872 RepID=A0A9N7RIW5_STRHE|nr:Eukaryotic aspartyl protease family protein [Striga hermonthica]
MILIGLSSPSSSSSSNPPTARHHVLKLVHYLSNMPNISPEEAFRLDWDHSVSRSSYLAASSDIIRTKSNIEASLYSAGSAYNTLVRVGTGPDPPLLSIIVDSGSSLMWVHCRSFDSDKFFNPSASPTFRKEIMCNNPTSACPDLQHVNCRDNECWYTLEYGSGTSSGYLARDRFQFHSLDNEDDDEPFSLENITFGCDINGSLTDINGILGLINYRDSLVSQMGYSRFAYCLGNITDPAYPYNLLIIGDGDEIGLHGSQTPLYIDYHYNIRLEDIAVGGRPVNGFGSHMMIVDCGSTFTFLPRQAVRKLETRIEEVIGGKLTKIYYTYDSSTVLCYVGSVRRDLVGFPVVELKFQGGAVLELTAENMFRDVGNGHFCLSAVENEGHGGYTILGTHMQQFLYIAFDLKEKQISFQRMECDVLRHD